MPLTDPTPPSGEFVTSQRMRIQQALVDLALGTEFLPVAYDSDGKPTPVSPATPRITPSTPVLCNEIETSFIEDERYGRDRIRQRASWRFALRFRFSREVLLDFFEEYLMTNPVFVPADTSLGLPSVTLLIVSAEITHPVQQQGATGTVVEYIFEAEQGRK